MNDIQWDIKEVKRLKIKLLLQYNLVALLLFLLFGYFVTNGKISLLFVGMCVILWILAASSLYCLITEKFIGTKTGIMVQEFDRNHLGQQRWKRRKMIETAFIIIISVFSTIFVIININTFNSETINSHMYLFPFIAAYLGYNTGEIYRISKL